ncbi:MAG: carboxymuconolactone decarboxylase family protein [Pseudomonadota bacterium]
MARVRDVPLEEVPPALRPLYERFSGSYGPFANQVGVMAHRPPALAHLMGMLLELSDEALLPKRYLEIALVAVSKLNACRYCVTHHTPRLVEEGLSAATAEAILEPHCPGLDQIDLLVRDFSVAVTLTPQRIPDAMFARLKEHFDDAQIVELTLRTALCGFFNRFNDVLQIDIEPQALRDLLAAGGSIEPEVTSG